MLADAASDASDAANGAQKWQASRLCNGIGGIAACGADESKQGVNTFVDELFGIDGGLSGVVKVVKSLDLDLVAGVPFLVLMASK